MEKIPFVRSKKFIFLAAILFMAVYAAIYYVNLANADKAFALANEGAPAIKAFSISSAQEVKGYAHDYGVFAGAAFGLVLLAIMFIVRGILSLFSLNRKSFSNPLAIILGVLPLFGLAYNLLYISNRFTVIGNAVIFYAGHPLYYSSIAMIVAAIIFFIISLTLKSGAKNVPLAVLLAASAFILSGCSDIIGMSMMYGCGFVPDSGHCYQSAAVQSGDANGCEKVAQPEEFKKSGSNPPKDKCFMMVAENTGNPEVCKRMQGGMFSYEPAECVTDIAVEKKDPEACKSFGEQLTECADKASDKLFDDVDAKLAGKDKLTDEEIADIQAKLEKVSRTQSMVSNSIKSELDTKKALVGNLR